MILYLAGGVIMWLGIYGYLKTRGAIGSNPVPGSDLIYHVCGRWIGPLASLVYIVGMVMLFDWWLAIVFVVVGGLSTGILYSKLAPYGASVAITCVPVGIAVATASLLL
jgi:hypothetical protein